MSAGIFSKLKYQASYDTLNIHPIRVQPETALCQIGTVTNAQPTAAQNNPIGASVSRSRRARGLNARLVTLQAPATGQPTGYKPLGITSIPALTPAFATAANNWVVGTTITYLGVTGWTVVGKVREERVN